MTSDLINVTTGPVNISPQVQAALAETPVSHRSVEFKHLFSDTTELLCAVFQAKQAFILTGSGTLANEVMMQEIRLLGGKGLILSNGEFGLRLVEQARCNRLDFLEYRLEWGQVFDLDEIARMLAADAYGWILFCHCETSTGTINDLASIVSLAGVNGCLSFVDCMSTVGTRKLDLSGVAMATASSGKGLAAIPGLALIFSNMDHGGQRAVPVYMDLAQYSRMEGIPFTIPSNLVKALSVSLRQKLCDEQFEMTRAYANILYEILNRYSCCTLSSHNSSVFTIQLDGMTSGALARAMEEQGILISSESGYLKARNWSQAALFGYYTEDQLKFVIRAFGQTFCRPLALS